MICRRSLSKFQKSIAELDLRLWQGILLYICNNIGIVLRWAGGGQWEQWVVIRVTDSRVRIATRTSRALPKTVVCKHIWKSENDLVPFFSSLHDYEFFINLGYSSYSHFFHWFRVLDSCKKKLSRFWARRHALSLSSIMTPHYRDLPLIKKRKLAGIGGVELQLAYNSLLKLKKSFMYDETEEESEVDPNELAPESFEHWQQVDKMLSLLGFHPLTPCSRLPSSAWRRRPWPSRRSRLLGILP